MPSQLTRGRSVQSQPLRAWKLGLTASHGFPSPKSRLWHGCLHGNTFWRWGWGLVLGVGSSRMLDPTLNPSPTIIFAWNKQDPVLMIFSHVWIVLWDSRVGTWDSMWIGPCSRGASSQSRAHLQSRCRNFNQVGTWSSFKLGLAFRPCRNQYCHDTCLGFEC